MVVKPTGEVLVHYNANELLKVAEEDHIFTGAFSMNPADKQYLKFLEDGVAAAEATSTS